MKLKHIFFHQWGKWEEYQQAYTCLPLFSKDGVRVESFDNMQMRVCGTCGKTQREKV